MKNLLVDLYKIKDMESGLGQFSMNFANELTHQLPENLIIDFLIPSKNEATFAGNNVNVVRTSLQKRYLPSLNKKYLFWHSLQQFPSFLPKKNTVWILTIHDLNFLTEKKGWKRKQYLKRLQKNIDRADYITTISYYTKEQIEKNIDLRGKEVLVIYNGIDLETHVNKIKPTFVRNKKYFFSIGIFSRKKNFKSLVPLMKYFEDYQLVIAGNKDTDYGKDVQEEIDKLNLNERVILPGKISESDKQWLYANSEALLFPSLAEGFGMPIIEQMKAGKPVFLSRYASLPEIGGPLAFYFDNFDEHHMSNLIKTKLEYVHNNQDDFTIELKKYAENFSWKSCMTKYLNLYREVEMTTHNKQ